MKSFTIASATAREAIRQPAFFVLAFIAAASLLGSMVVPYFTFGEDIKMYKDTGLTTISFTCLILAALYWRIDVKQKRFLTFPFVVVGMNSIAMYCLVHLIDKFLGESLKVHLGRNVFQLFGVAFERMFEGGAVLAVLWLICYWMYRKGLFLRI